MKRRHFLLSAAAVMLRPWKWIEPKTPFGFHQRNALANQFMFKLHFTRHPLSEPSP